MVIRNGIHESARESWTTTKTTKHVQQYCQGTMPFYKIDVNISQDQWHDGLKFFLGLMVFDRNINISQNHIGRDQCHFAKSMSILSRTNSMLFSRSPTDSYNVSHVCTCVCMYVCVCVCVCVLSPSTSPTFTRILSHLLPKHMQL
jgi:hypothetical protein